MIHGPIFEQFGSDKRQFVESLKKERDLNADILCERRIGVIKGREIVRRYLEGYIRESSV